MKGKQMATTKRKAVKTRTLPRMIGGDGSLVKITPAMKPRWHTIDGILCVSHKHLSYFTVTDAKTGAGLSKCYIFTRREAIKSATDRIRQNGGKKGVNRIQRHYLKTKNFKSTYALAKKIRAEAA